MKRVCVYCGSSLGKLEQYQNAAQELGALLAERGMGLVYGGASVGIMGVVADAVLANGGEVIGVIPESLDKKEVSHFGLNQLHVVSSMHERKTKMAELADGFIALPGGLGTLEELFEMLTWAQLGFHQKPIGLLNVSNYYDALREFLDHAVNQAFMKPAHQAMLLVDELPHELLNKMEQFKPTAIRKWIAEGQT